VLSDRPVRRSCSTDPSERQATASGGWRTMPYWDLSGDAFH
jgi:hypothetical protein